MLMESYNNILGNKPSGQHFCDYFDGGARSVVLAQVCRVYHGKTGSISQRPLNCGSFILLSQVSRVKNSEVFVCSKVMGLHPFKAHPKRKVSSRFGIIPIFTFTKPQHLLWGEHQPLRNETIILHLLQGTIKLVTKRNAQKKPCRIVVLQNSFQEPRPKGSCLTSCGMPSGHAVSFAAGDRGKHTRKIGQYRQRNFK